MYLYILYFYAFTFIFLYVGNNAICICVYYFATGVGHLFQARPAHPSAPTVRSAWQRELDATKPFDTAVRRTTHGRMTS